jgi:glycosidase
MLAKDTLYTNPDLLVTLVGSHDDGRFMSEPGATVAGLKLAHTFLLTTRGVPQIYYGDEIAMTGADEPTTRQDFPGGFPGDRRNAFTRAGRTEQEQDIFEHTRRVARLRAELEPLRRGALVTLRAAEQQYAYARVSERGAVIVVLNNDTKPATLEFSIAPARVRNGVILDDPLGTIPYVRVRGDMMTLTLPPRSSGILTDIPAR